MKDFSLMTLEAKCLARDIYSELNKTKGIADADTVRMASELIDVAVDLYLYTKGFNRERI